jgi:hypothetical protein
MQGVSMLQFTGDTFGIKFASNKVSDSVYYELLVCGGDLTGKVAIFAYWSPKVKTPTGVIVRKTSIGQIKSLGRCEFLHPELTDTTYPVTPENPRHCIEQFTKAIEICEDHARKHFG